MTFNQYRVYMRFVAARNDCTHFGTIHSCVDRTNDVPRYLEKLGVEDLGIYLLINERTQAFVYDAEIIR